MAKHPEGSVMSPTRPAHRTEGETVESSAPRPRTTASRRAVEDDRSIVDLVRQLAGEGSRLARQEVELAKAEMRETADVYERSAVKLAAGGLLLGGALFMALVAVNRGLTALLEGVVAVETAIWLAPLLLALLLGAVGWGIVSDARKKMSRESLVPDKAMATARNEADWLKHKAKEAGNG
ncbi:MAG: phage holin family protein [Gemmatimonadota bacterium]